MLDRIKEESGCILTAQRECFANMYKCKVVNDDSSHKIDQVMSSSKDYMYNRGEKSYEGILVEDEADYALKQIKNGSAPSNDGITVEVLNVFWSFIGETVLLAFSSAFANGQYCLQKEKQ